LCHPVVTDTFHSDSGRFRGETIAASSEDPTMASRRDFLRASATTLGGLGLAGAIRPGRASATASVRPARGRAPDKLRILILGGTGFIGPYEVRYAVERGHKVTVFNRGKRPSDLPASVEHLTGDRDVGDYRSLGGKKWDVVIDNPTTLPRWVKDAGEALKGSVDRYIFISTISVYGQPKGPPDETAATDRWQQAEDPLQYQKFDRALMQYYGALKARSEQEAERIFPGKTTVIRPGLIVGPEDPTDRFTYWPVRIDRGGEVLCPGTPNDPAQIIDARDLSEWIVRMAESGTSGIFNATGPRARLSFAEMLYGCRAVTSGSNDIKFTWADADFLAAEKVQAWSDMPVWFPPKSPMGSMGETSIAKAIAAGLTFRPLAVTARDTIDWFKKLPAERQAAMKAGLKPDREAQVLAAWHAKADKAGS
jgi:2'-hydroxyisoflavone reductase